MVKALFDTNILIDYLNAVPQARTELDRYNEKAISIITWMEVMIGADSSVEAATLAFLEAFKLITIDDAVAQCAVKLRKEHRIKLPDAIVWASAQTNAMLLVTRNTKDFPVGDPAVRVPYQF
ncbi:MAG TPA: type II toxin-antitoxin system VapC family toxin [Rhodospirillaceae bacterium]|nr:type II toxin-antitoxin system VapC family toxin [Rhodospirillaceae bacterium]